MKEIVLKKLSPFDGEDCYNMLQHIGAFENDFTNPVHDMTYEQFKDWLKSQDDWSRGDNLPFGYVPQICYWLMVDNTPVGFGKIRLGLTPRSREEGGNIGYAIDSRYRGKGYGSKLLELLLQEIKALHIESNLITVKKYNYASKKVAENNGAIIIKETDTWWYLTI